MTVLGDNISYRVLLLKLGLALLVEGVLDIALETRALFPHHREPSLDYLVYHILLWILLFPFLMIKLRYLAKVLVQKLTDRSKVFCRLILLVTLLSHLGGLTFLL